jgi:biofilm PGA synthesis N-glycosyltransferase PgaC
MIAWLALSGTLSMGYAALLWACSRAWAQQPDCPPGTAASPSVSVTVLVPARNEAARLPALLESLCAQDHLPLEVLVVDDHSRDGTADVVRTFQAAHPSFPLRLVALPEGRQGKKAAIEAGVELAQGKLLACTDADCTVPSGWIRLLAEAHERTGAVLIAGPVAFHGEKTTFERFQTLDFFGMVGLASVGLHRRWWRMANGANLAYTREAFWAVGGFEGHRHLPSGDDMFLAQRMAQTFPEKLFFLKNAQTTVLTRPETSLRGFVRQRIRWGGKSRHFPEKGLTTVLGIVWLLCWCIAANAAVGLAYIGSPQALFFFGATIAQITVKGIADHRWLLPLARFFGRPELMRPGMFLYASAAHWIYILVVGTLSALSVRVRWKGRR